MSKLFSNSPHVIVPLKTTEVEKINNLLFSCYLKFPLVHKMSEFVLL